MLSQKIANICTGVIRTLLTPLKEQRREITASIVSQNLIPQPTVDTPFGPIKFHCPNKEALEYPRDLLTRETDTIDWIKSFSDGVVFWDIGANVGAYSLFAARVAKSTVLAFEPSAQSFSLLVKNIEINALDSLVWPFCLALSNRTTLDFLNMPHTYASSVLNVFGDHKNALGGETDAAFRQMVPGFSIDDFVKIFDPPLPDHIKLDVDSLEPQILEGAQELLGSGHVKSILVEAVVNEDSSNYDLITARLEAAGFKPSFSGDSSKTGNIIFVR